MQTAHFTLLDLIEICYTYRVVSATGEENRTMSQLIFNPKPDTKCRLGTKRRLQTAERVQNADCESKEFFRLVCDNMSS